MNLLLVDDEYFSVENLKTKLDWPALGFAQVHCAYSMAQAQEVFAAHAIDIMLCDIEMPKGSGLDLLEWVRGKGLPTVCIFLTCFAEFGYANRALQLESSDYLLKPVETDALQAAVVKAVSKRREAEAEQLNRLHADYWLSGDVQRKESFWQTVLSAEFAATPQALARALHQAHLPETYLAQSYSVVWVKYAQSAADASWEPQVLAYAVKNILNELFGGAQGAVLVPLPQKQIALVLPCMPAQLPALQAQCEAALQTCTSVLGGVFRFYLDVPCAPSNLSACAAQLRKFAYNDVAQQSAVVLRFADAAGGGTLPPLPADEWTQLLLARKVEDVRRAAVLYVQTMAHKKRVSRHQLAAFYHDFSQVLYALLEKKGAAAHSLFAGDGLPTAEQVCENFATLEAWIEEILTSYTELMALTDESGSVIEDVKRYVQAHLAEDINRNALAQAVFLSPDYLSHLFRDKTGASLTSYITAQRIQKAKELLLDARLSVRDIALASGFQNISYFSKQFKRATGQTPQDYRKGDTP